jgi:hypothetical protein
VGGELKIKSLVMLVAPPQRRAKSGTSSPEKKGWFQCSKIYFLLWDSARLEQVFGVSRELISQVK